jgi:hypothetical protein
MVSELGLKEPLPTDMLALAMGLQLGSGLGLGEALGLGEGLGSCARAEFAPTLTEKSNPMATIAD